MSLLLSRCLSMASGSGRRLPKHPIVAIVGATGTGKSKLAVDLATHFNGEIINADAMQIYKGLPIITNKMPLSERNGIPHHFLDSLELGEQPWTVRNFVQEAQRLITEIRGRGRLPLVVGGTGYYVHSLLFKEALLDREEHRNSGRGEEDDELTDPHFEILSKPTEEILARLREADPGMADRWHPRDRRKIQRSLEIYLRTGKRASDFYREQGQRSHPREPTELTNEGREPSSDALRYEPLILWLDAEDHALKSRLNARVHTMIAAGLVDEAASMLATEKKLRSQAIPLDTSKGIWVSIGYKELRDMLDRQQSEGSPQDASLIPQEAIEAIQAITRQYAKRQNRFIRLRFANAVHAAGVDQNLFVLDCSDLNCWEEAVADPSQALVSAFLQGEHLPEPAMLSDLARKTFATISDATKTSAEYSVRRCEFCDKILMSENELLNHLKSNSHRKVVAGQRKRAMRLQDEQQKSADELQDVSIPG